MKEMRNSQGVVFDLKKELVEGFIENFKLLQERESGRVDFKVKVCTRLPDTGNENFEDRRNKN